MDIDFYRLSKEEINIYIEKAREFWKLNSWIIDDMEPTEDFLIGSASAIYERVMNK